MANINFLDDIYSKKGEEFIKKLFNLNVTVSEKISGASFGFEYESNKFKFFKKTNGDQLTKVDRVLMKFYEKPIEYFENLDKDILKEISSEYRFMFEYFVDKSPHSILYDNLPKNNLILTHLLEIDSKKIIVDIETLNKWAKLLDVNKPSIIFQGKLSDDAKDKIFQFLRMSKKQALETFKTTSFTKFLITALNPDLEKTALNDDIEKTIDDIIFSFENGEEKITAKVVDPVFLEILKKNKEESKSTLLPVIFGDMIEFMELHRSIWEKYEFTKIDFYDRYLEIMSKLFLSFYKKNEDKYKDFSVSLPEFMNKSGFDINTNLLFNKNLILLFEKSPNTKDLFRIFIALFRKKKKKIEEFISSAAIEYQNSIVNDLQDILSKDNSQNESSIPLFSEICENMNEDLDLYDFQDISDLHILENEEAENTSGINSMIAFWQNAFGDKKVLEKNEKLKKVNLVVGKFQPINNKHLKFIKELNEKNDSKVVLFQINDSKSKNKLFSSEVSNKLFEKLLENKEIDSLIEKIFVIEKNNLEKMMKSISENYSIESIGISEKYKEYFKKQLEYSVNKGSSYDILLESYKTDYIDNIEISNKKIIESIKDNDYKTFRKLCPKEIWSYFDKLREELK